MSTTITRDELRAAIDTGRATVVDALPPATYAKRHLPGAINLANESSDEQIRAALPDLEAPVVTYSSNDRCTRGNELVARLRKLGYLDVRAYSGGLDDWLAAGLPIEPAGEHAADAFTPTRLVVLPDGPYEVSGPLEIARPGSAPTPAPDPAYLCRCGHSANKPFCDGSHHRAAWKEDA
jgi:rhodanese-related sulfurtransferase